MNLFEFTSRDILPRPLIRGGTRANPSVSPPAGATQTHHSLYTQAVGSSSSNCPNCGGSRAIASITSYTSGREVFPGSLNCRGSRTHISGGEVFFQTLQTLPTPAAGRSSFRRFRRFPHQRRRGLLLYASPTESLGNCFLQGTFVRSSSRLFFGLSYNITSARKIN